MRGREGKMEEYGKKVERVKKKREKREENKETLMKD